MGKKDPRVDAYIDKSADFAKPILMRLRKLVHEGCPQVEETIKWSFPHFQYKGMLCSMAAFKAHCAFGFWKAGLLAEKHPELFERTDEAMGHLGRIGSLDDLPADRTLLRYVKDAVALKDSGAARPVARRRTRSKEAAVPPDLAAALRKNARARSAFEGFSPSHRREYVEWITDAKSSETRARRLQTTLDWLDEGKRRNWKYEDKQRKRRAAV